jgi:NAD(P)-dependent dehydrogenase (short-subunit alcohol dehydrogenase family)
VLFSGKIALVTGAGRGIGAETARLLGSEGAKVFIVSRTETELNQVAESIGKDVAYLVGDISDESFVKKVFQSIEEKWGGVDILVNNAGIITNQAFTEMPTSTWDEILSVNLRSFYLCSREAFLQMKHKGGVIINISSLSGIKGTEKFPGYSAYTVSKHGVIGLTEALAVEGRNYGIRVNAVAPGAINTAMLKKAAPLLKSSTNPEQVAEVIASLCEDKNSCLTGAVVEIHSNL